MTEQEIQELQNKVKELETAVQSSTVELSTTKQELLKKEEVIAEKTKTETALVDEITQLKQANLKLATNGGGAGQKLKDPFDALFSK